MPDSPPYNLARRLFDTIPPHFGEGVAQDYAKAAAWYEKAAQQGDAKAQFSLGNGYYFGEGVEQDYAKAVAWFDKAAQQGLAEAQYNLGICYDKGWGVAQNHAEAAAWYEKAAQQGLFHARNLSAQPVKRADAVYRLCGIVIFFIDIFLCLIAQLVEQRTENPCVTGSIPVQGTNDVSVRTNRTDRF